MPGINQSARTTEFAEVVRGFMRLKRHLKLVVPQDVAEARDRFHKLLPDGPEWSPNDFDLFYNVGALLYHQQEPMTMGELSQALDVPLSTATRIVDHLVKNDYAMRLPDPGDRRIVRVTLAMTGQQMYQVIDGFIQTRLDQILRHFTPEEQESLLGLLHRLLNAIGEEV
jgi:DNA-binding MarR family transcriptional regulator